MNHVPEKLWCRMRGNGYDVQKFIGNGFFSRAYMAMDRRSHQKVAIKAVAKKPLNEVKWDDVALEIILLHKIQHKHIVRMYNWIWDFENVYIVQEYCDGGTLTTFIKDRGTLTDKMCRVFLQQLASAIKYLRTYNISHIDLKPDNIFVSNADDLHIKLGDFGLAKILKADTRLMGHAGSPIYMAPEVTDKNFGIEADLWSIGIIVFECMFGEAPYARFSTDMIEFYYKNRFPILIPYDKISFECGDLLTRLLKFDLSERMTHDEFYMHPFVKLNDYLRTFEAPEDNSIDTPTLSDLCQNVPYLQSPFGTAKSGNRHGTKRANDLTSKELKICFIKLKQLIKDEPFGTGYDIPDEYEQTIVNIDLLHELSEDEFNEDFEDFEDYVARIKKPNNCLKCFNCFKKLTKLFKRRNNKVT